MNNLSVHIYIKPFWEIYRHMSESPHIPVLTDAVLKSFEGCKEGFVVDCTLGYAGHSYAILENFDNISIVGIDRDEEALNFSRNRLAEYQDRFVVYKGTFAQTLQKITQRPIVGILADFGVSSLQLDKIDRGFSFDSELLDMRMDRDERLTAYDVVNSYEEERLIYVFKNYGEIPQAKKLAAEVIRTRSISPIKTAKELSRIAKKVIYSGSKIHPATLMFQAIRIEVNDELGQIEGLLDTIESMKPSGAVISLITFHSLEDRLVKNRFRKWAKQCICDPQAMRCSCSGDNDLGKILNRKPITADAEEIRQNPRSRSAKLRSFRFKEGA